MKQTIAILLMGSMILSCSESSSKKSSSSNTNQYGACVTDYYTNPNCPGYGQTTGSTTSGSTSGGSYTGLPSFDPPKDNDWASLYPGGEPQGSCSSPTGSGYPLREGTITMAGGQMYQPNLPFYSLGEAEYAGVGYSHNISYFLTTVEDAKAFLSTDAVLKIRVKPRPQPKAPKNKSWCFGRTFASPDTYGYTSLRYSVSVRAVNADGSLGPLMGTKQQTTSVNSCSAAMDFSGFAQSAPNGLVFAVHDVQSQRCWYSSGCTTWETEKSKHCWSMDIQVAVDGTKSI